MRSFWRSRQWSRPPAPPLLRGHRSSATRGIASHVSISASLLSPARRCSPVRLPLALAPWLLLPSHASPRRSRPPQRPRTHLPPSAVPFLLLLRYSSSWTPAGGHSTCCRAWHPDTAGQPAQPVGARFLGCQCHPLVMSPLSWPQPADHRSPFFRFPRRPVTSPTTAADRQHPPPPPSHTGPPFPIWSWLSGRLVEPVFTVPVTMFATC